MKMRMLVERKEYKKSFQCDSSNDGETLYRVSMEEVATGRPFVTKEGYVGMGPKGAAPGDIVVVLFGGAVPYVEAESGS